MKGYKATDKDMRCKNVQFELDKWYECEGDLKLCENGFHFCEHPSGVWAYYSEEGTRVFEIEAEGVLDTAIEPGADFKRVCRRIRFIKELIITGDGNTGDRNTGDGNTGNRNTGNRNTGDGNTGNRNPGYWNTGNRNTGYWNTGDGNTGDGNTGDGNTGDGNTGNRNTGYWNTGYWNTGYWNTGDWNTGNGNTTNNSAGFFCSKEPKIISFDTQTQLTKNEYVEQYPCVRKLLSLLGSSEKIDFEQFKEIPGITPKKLQALHEKHLAARGLLKEEEK